MMLARRLTSKTTVAAVAVFISAATLLAQTPIPVPGQRGPGARGAQGGQRGAQQPAAPVQQAVAPIASAMEVTGPGPFFETFMDTHDDEKDVQVPAKDVYAKYNYEAKEYFVSGMTSKGQPYKTRIVIRSPKNNSRFSGVILAESMHPSGNPWVFHNTHVYSMTNGVIGLELLTAASPGLVASNEARYKDLIIPEGSANDIIAQVGALMKSQRPDNPLRGAYGSKDDSDGAIRIGGGCAELLIERPYGAPAGRHEAHLRWDAADQQQRSGSGPRHSDNPRTDDARDGPGNRNHAKGQ